jgi:anti-anti-sigma factor
MWQSMSNSRPGRIEIGGEAPPAGPATITDDSGLITVSAMESVALVFIGIAQVRERQAELIQDRLRTIADRTSGKVAVSLSEIIIMTSAGINALVAANAHCETLGGHLSLFAASRDLRKMFKVTKLDRKLVITSTAHEAVRSYDGRPFKRSFLQAALSWARSEKDAA